MTTNYLPHQSVLAQECLQLLSQNSWKDESQVWMIDCTFGAVGHSLLFLQTHPNLKGLAIDQDIDAINNGKNLIKDKGLEERLKLVQGNFAQADQIIQSELSGKNIQIILADIGVSSHHFDEKERGFSFRKDGPLDMRMNRNQELSAKDVVNDFSQKELAEIFEKYAQEPFDKKIAAAIVKNRSERKIETTAQLEEICFLSYPPALRHKGKHPALRVFQAVRLFVNQELEVLEESLPKWFNHLSPGGRLGVISFHSLEDRIVKHSFLNWSKVIWLDKAKIITKKPIISGAQELLYNQRARSAKLRVIERVAK